MKPIFSILALLFLFVLFSCSQENEKANEYEGRLDTDIIRISAQTPGLMLKINVSEGDAVQKGQMLALVDTQKINILLKQQKAQEKEILANEHALQAQILQAQLQLNFSRRTLSKTEKIAANGAATEQKLDELKTQSAVQQARLAGLENKRKGLDAKRQQLQEAMNLTRLNQKHSSIISPINGIVINKLLSVGEWAAPGLPVLELADLSRLEATVYLPLTDLNRIKIGQQAKIHIDGSRKIFNGRVKWVASQAEFTPKTILTKETRTSLVYSVKIDVPNPDGILKIGMPVQVAF